jgi:4-hydroxybenzoyl-CoA thioesterase
MTLNKEFLLPIRVYIEDTDAGGIVYYVNYLKFMERSRTEFLRSLGYGKTSVLDDGLLLVVHSLVVNYQLPAKLDDELIVGSSILKLARSHIAFKQQIRRGQTLLCNAEVTIACVNARLRPTGLPIAIRESISHYMQQ